MKKQRLLTLAIVICLLACLFTACSNNSNSGGGKPNNSGGTPDCTHTSTRWITDEEATCTTDGSKHKECSSCGKTLDTESIPKGHDYYELVVPPTEEQQGYTLHQCSRCNDSYKDNFVDPPVGENPPVGEYTEAEHKEMFETNLLAAIQNDYNENRAPVENLFLHELELELVNYETGDVYFTCTQNNKRVMIIANSEEVAQWATYEALYENLPETFSFTKAVSVQEDDIAKEIVEFALTQPELQEYITTNNLDLSNYTVINATEFRSSDAGRSSTIILKADENILTFSIGGPTGYCSSQEGYLTKVKDLSKVEVDDIQHAEYYEIPVVTE